GSRKGFTREGTEGREERGQAVMTDDDRAGRERTETKPAKCPARAGWLGSEAAGRSPQARGPAPLGARRPRRLDPSHPAGGPDGETNEPASSRVRPAVPA